MPTWSAFLTLAFAAMGNTTVGAAGNTTSGGGLTDVNGSCLSISGGKLQVKQTSSLGRNSNWGRAGTTLAMNQRIVAVISGDDLLTGTHCLMLRQLTTGDYVNEYLRVKFTAATPCVVTIDGVVPLDAADGNSHLSAVMTTAASANFTPASGVDYSVDASAVGCNPTTVTVVVTRLDTSAVVLTFTSDTSIGGNSERFGQAAVGYQGVTIDGSNGSTGSWKSLTFHQDLAVEAGYALPDPIAGGSTTARITALAFQKATSYSLYLNGVLYATQASPVFNVTGLTANTSYTYRVDASDGTTTVSSVTRSFTTKAASSLARRIAASGHSWIAGTGASTAAARLVAQTGVALNALDPAHTYSTYAYGIGGTILYNWTRNRENWTSLLYNIANNGCTVFFAYYNVNDSNFSAAAMQTWYGRMADGLNAIFPGITVVLIKTARTLDTSKIPAATCIAFNAAIDTVASTRAPWCYAGGGNLYTDFDNNANAFPTSQGNPPTFPGSYYTTDNIHCNDGGYTEVGLDIAPGILAAINANTPVTSGSTSTSLGIKIGLGF